MKCCRIENINGDRYGRTCQAVGGGGGGSFSTLDNFNMTGFISGCENWDRYDFKALLKLVKSF